jgi:uncharacterized MAPEG superfamily protein
MMTTVQALVWSGILTFVMAVVAAGICIKAWAPSGMQTAFGNREDLARPEGFAGRADRASKNQLEAMIMFTALVLAAHVAGKAPQVALGATVFFWARLIYWPIYLADIIYLRTLVWFVGVFGLILIMKELL